MFGTDTRGRLLKGTAAAVVRHGVDGSTVQHILDAAGVSRRTFYRWFSDRDDALDALYEVSIALVRGTLQLAIAGESTALGRLIGALDAFLDLQITGGNLVRVLEAEALRPDSRLAARRAALLDEVVALFDAGVAPDSGTARDPWYYRALVLALEGLIHHAHRQGPFTTAERDRVRAVMLPLIFRALELEPEHAAAPGASR
ncbi:MAG: TetR/AcrR family transcriptional regulator [Myxococcota bacterium]